MKIVQKPRRKVMERLQRSENSPANFFQSEINGRLNLQLNNGISYGRGKRRDNDSNRSPTTGESTEIEEEDPEEDDYTDEHSPPNYNKESNQSRKPMVCGVCHLSPGVAGVAGVSASPGPMLTCTQGHLLCQQCVYRYTVCSDVGCVVCGADLYKSNSACHRVNSSTNSHYPNLQSSSLENSRGVEAVRMNNTRTLPRVEESDQSKNWSRNNNENSGSGAADNGVILQGGNSRCSPGYGMGFEGDSGDAIRSNRTTNENLRLQQHQQRSYCSIYRGDADPEVEGAQRICHSAKDGTGNAALVHAECSRRPIRCPRLDCAVNVAFSALTHHFLFDHPEVPILSVEPGAKSTLIVSFAALSCDSSRCLALLLVSGKLTGAAERLFNGSQIQPRYRNRLPLPVLAARLHCSNQNPCDDETHAHGEGQGQGDVIIAWVAGLDVGVATTGTLRCSIQAVDGNDGGELRSLTYTGPVNSLRTAQRPREVFKTGDCVILHQGLLNHITSGCTSLNVNVIVH